MVFRTLKMEHLASLIELDLKITGEDHREFFEKHFHNQMLLGQDELMFGAFEGATLNGFLLASVRQLAFGQHQEIAYLEMIEVVPGAQKSGVGTLLLKEFVRRLKELKILRVITVVDWKETRLLSFFNAQGFRKGEMLQLELQY